MNVAYPYRFDGRGRTADSSQDDHIREMIQQVLFTAPGERVNRPGFGSGLMRLVFGPNSDELAAATQFLVQSSLQEWLGDLVQIIEVRVTSVDASLDVSVDYIVRRTQERRTDRFTSGGTAA
jgi:phage baseplate assembly protein W